MSRSSSRGGLGLGPVGAVGTNPQSPRIYDAAYDLRQYAHSELLEEEDEEGVYTMNHGNIMPPYRSSSIINNQDNHIPIPQLCFNNNRYPSYNDLNNNGLPHSARSVVGIGGSSSVNVSKKHSFTSMYSYQSSSRLNMGPPSNLNSSYSESGGFNSARSTNNGGNDLQNNLRANHNLSQRSYTESILITKNRDMNDMPPDDYSLTVRTGSLMPQSPTNFLSPRSARIHSPITATINNMKNYRSSPPNATKNVFMRKNLNSTMASVGPTANSSSSRSNIFQEDGQSNIVSNNSSYYSQSIPPPPPDTRKLRSLSSESKY